MNQRFTRRQFLAGSTAPVFCGIRMGWQAGTAKIRITPERPLWQAGYAARTKASEGTLEEIYVRALALDDGTGSAAVLVSSDLLGFPRPTADRIARQASDIYEIRRQRLILNS